MGDKIQWPFQDEPSLKYIKIDENTLAVTTEWASWATETIQTLLNERIAKPKPYFNPNVYFPQDLKAYPKASEWNISAEKLKQIESMYVKFAEKKREMVDYNIRCVNMDAFYTIFGCPPPGTIGTRELIDMCWKYLRECGYLSEVS